MARQRCRRLDDAAEMLDAGDTEGRGFDCGRQAEVRSDRDPACRRLLNDDGENWRGQPRSYRNDIGAGLHELTDSGACRCEIVRDGGGRPRAPSSVDPVPKITDRRDAVLEELCLHRRLEMHVRVDEPGHDRASRGFDRSSRGYTIGCRALVDADDPARGDEQRRGAGDAPVAMDDARVPHGKIERAGNRSREEDQAGEAEQGFRHGWRVT